MWDQRIEGRDKKKVIGNRQQLEGMRNQVDRVRYSFLRNERRYELDF
jgi:hypothetical protein